jgi:arylsulfatase A-like enzyme
VDPAAVLRISFWFGLVTGVAELGLTLVQKPLTDPSPGLFRMNRHILWTLPTVNLALFVLCGLVAALAIRIVPRLRVRRAVIGWFAFLGVFTILLSCRWLHTIACLVLAFSIALRIISRIEKNYPAFQRLVRRTSPAIGLLSLGLIGMAISTHRLPASRATSVTPGAPMPGQVAPNVLLVVLDTVRADHLSLYGYRRETSPNLARLARRGVTFTRARSTAPWTLPSHASIMTGRGPHELSTGVDSPLDETHPTIAEFFAAAGYATAGFIANATYCGKETGLDRGFAHYEDHVPSLADALWTTDLGRRVLLPALFPPEPRFGGNPNDYHRKDAATVRRDMLAWLANQEGRPFFAFINLYDAHDPYIPPADWKRRFSEGPRSARDWAILSRWFISDKKKLSWREIQLVLDAYDEGIAYLDEQVGFLFDDLERAGRLANTVVIITADHGEHLGEHELYGHASSLYDAEIHVPLLVFLPGGANAGQTVTSQVSLRDLAATIADLTKLTESPFPGRSLARYWAADAPADHEPSLSEVDAPVKTSPNQGRSPVFRGPLKAVAFGNHVYIKRGDGREELFDVESDPFQSRDLSELARSQPILDQSRGTLERLFLDKSGVTPGSPKH